MVETLGFGIGGPELDVGDCLLQFLSIARHDHDVGAFLGELMADFLAHAARAAGDEDGLWGGLVLGLMDRWMDDVD